MGIETKFKQCEYGTMISTSAVAELQELSIRNGVMTIGGAVTLSTLEHFLETQETNVRYQAMLDMLRWFASAQIRNVAVLAGNIATASPISDMNPVLMALDASLILASAGQAPREVPMKEFFKSYRVVDMQAAEVICAIKVPSAGDFEFVRSFKQARRRDDDISIVNACLRVTLQPNSGGWRVETASAAFGGMAPTTLRATKLEATLTGAPWNKETLEKAQEVLAEELSLPETVPGGMAAYRQTLAASFLYKFYVATCLDLSKRAGASLPPAPTIAPDEVSAARSFLSEDRPLTHGSQAYVVPSGGLQSTSVMGQDHAPLEEESRAPVGQPLMHRSALPQCTGEAKYTDDMPKLPGTLHGVLVLSERPHAKILSIDTSAALAYPKVVEVFTGKDLSEKQNAWGPAYVDEQLFRTDEVTSTGQALGIVVAETLEAAEKAARLVKVQYSDLEPIITVEDAIKVKSFKDKVLKIEDGDIESAFNQSDSVIVEGEVRMGGQEHFYLECNAALAVPGEADELTVHVSSQTANKTQKFAANVCGIPCSKVVCKVKRMGGGFGGKETRTVIFSTAAALAAHRLKQPVKINVDRDVDMWVTGGRHPFLARYRAAAGPDGKLRALDAKLYCNAGYSMDLTEPVMGRALFHSDGCYKIPNVRVEGFMCMTNTTSNTAFRGFGGPQGLMVAEAYMTHLASALKMSPEELRIRNTYAFEGEKTHFRQLMEKCPLQRMWHELYESCDFAKRNAEIQEFNRQNRWRKRGIAQLPTKFGISFTAKFMNQAGALVHIYTDGTVLLTHGGTEMGQGLHTKICQIVARAFGIPMADVVFRETGTDTVPNASPTAASASSDIYGMATLNACEQIKSRLQPYLEKFGDFKKAVNAAYMDRCDLSAHGFYATPGIGYDWSLPEDQRGKPFNYFTYGAASSEVEIDVLTGDMRILRSDILMDVGNSLNPAIDIGQIEGAFTQGFGWATLEETVWGCSEFSCLKPGVCFTRGPGTYKIPSFNDTPVDLRVTLVKDSANPNAIHSSRAVGEPPFFLGTAAFFAARAAIASAREDAGRSAQDYFVVDLPLTPERIRMACNDALSSRFSKNTSRPRPSIFV